MSAPTPGKLRVVKCKATFKLLDEHGYTVAETLLSGPEDQTNAERLARCSNAHQGLVESLEAVLGSAHPHSEENPAMFRAWKQARAALAAAKEAL